MLLNVLELSGCHVVAEEYDRRLGAVTVRSPLLVGLRTAGDIANFFVRLATELPGSHSMSVTINDTGAWATATLQHKDALREGEVEVPGPVRTAKFYDFRVQSADPFYISGLKLQVSRDQAGWFGRVDIEQVIMEDAWEHGFDCHAYARRRAEAYRNSAFGLERYEGDEWSSLLPGMAVSLGRDVSTEVIETSGRDRVKLFSLKVSAPLVLTRG
jgi:hypothetical protein